MSGINVVRDGYVLRVDLDRPDARNALDLDTVEGLLAAMQVEAGVRVVRLGATGTKAWCAGADLAALAGFPERRADAVRRYAALIAAIDACPVPVVATARAHVLAGGMGLWCAADVAVCAPGVTFSLPESGVGLWPMMVGAVLFRHLPYKVAMELALTGRRMPAEEALRWGLVNQIAEDPDGAADALCASIAAKSPAATRAGRAAWRAARNVEPGTALPALAEALVGAMEHPDAMEGVVAFLQKRTPVWGDG